MKQICAVVLFALVACVTPARAGTPMICFSFEPEGGPLPQIAALFGDRAPVGADRVLAVVRALDTEEETLVRMAILQRMARSPERALLVDRLSRVPKAEDERRAAARRFDRAFFAECCRYAGGEEAGTPGDALREAVRQLPGDGAAALGLARAITPLMRTGTLAEHADAFVTAWDAAEKMAPGPARERLRAVLDRDLASLESYLVDGNLKQAGVECSAVARMDALRRACGRERRVTPE